MLERPAAAPAASPRHKRAPLALLAADSLLLGATLLLAYLNMLVAMAFDWGLLCSLVAGEAATHFCLRSLGLPEQAVESSDHCH